MNNLKKNSQEKEIVQNVQKKPEFLEFLRLVEEENIPESWGLLAEAIGIHRNTITKWRKTPEFRKALAKGIQRSLRNMEKAGNKDWRMWREKLRILGVKDKKEDFPDEQGVIGGDEMKLEFIGPDVEKHMRNNLDIKKDDR